MQNRALEALEREEKNQRGKEPMSEGLQEVVKRTRDAIQKALDQPAIKKGARVKMTRHAR